MYKINKRLKWIKVPIPKATIKNKQIIFLKIIFKILYFVVEHMLGNSGVVVSTVALVRAIQSIICPSVAEIVTNLTKDRCLWPKNVSLWVVYALDFSM